jgi:hypothetical protein
VVLFPCLGVKGFLPACIGRHSDYLPLWMLLEISVSEII